MTQDGYGDALAVAYTSLLDSVQSRGEEHRGRGRRPIIFLTDEGHLITTNDLLGPNRQGTKMWRKLNIWFWLATQNLRRTSRQHGSRAVHVLRVLDAADHGQVGDARGHALGP